MGEEWPNVLAALVQKNLLSFSSSKEKNGHVCENIYSITINLPSPDPTTLCEQ